MSSETRHNDTRTWGRYTLSPGKPEPDTFTASYARDLVNRRRAELVTVKIQTIMEAIREACQELKTAVFIDYVDVHQAVRVSAMEDMRKALEDLGFSATVLNVPGERNGPRTQIGLRVSWEE